MSALTVFRNDDAELRVVVIDGEPWFVARDVCNAIGLPNLTMALSRLAVEDKGVKQIDTPELHKRLGGTGQLALVAAS